MRAMGLKRGVKEGAMSWRTYQVIFRLRSPLHIGHGKVGNLQRTRSYVTGRALWGAVTMRLTRDIFRGRGPVSDSREYRKMGDQVHQFLAFTYFYPALKKENNYCVEWPWEDEGAFRRRFLSGYQGAALVYPERSAAEGMLHEVEFISPYTLDTCEPVFLKGYVFEKKGCNLNWQSAFRRLQIGGERGYGWGDVELVDASPAKDEHIFGDFVTVQGDSERPIVHLSTDAHLLAHTPATNLSVSGDIEPLVGREWRSDNPHYRYAGQHVEFNHICFIPGSIVHKNLAFIVKEYGIWVAT